MQTEQGKQTRGVEAGQLWKLEHGYMYIVESGQRHIHYKLVQQPQQRAAITRIISLEPLLKFLTTSEARLVQYAN